MLQCWRINLARVGLWNITVLGFITARARGPLVIFGRIDANKLSMRSMFFISQHAKNSGEFMDLLGL